MDISELLKFGRSIGASDLHLCAGEPPIFRVDGDISRHGDTKLSAADMDKIAASLAARADVKLSGLNIDFGFDDEHENRQRVNIYRDREGYAAAVRFLSGSIPTIDQLGLPPILKQLVLLPRGLVLVTGPTGSGKSTTLAAMIEYVNTLRKKHIITMEDPIEYVHKNKNCIINQREIGKDTNDFADALRSALRQDPDIILVGEMRDSETISAALTAAETGHLVLSTLHTTGAAKTIDRIIDSFEPYRQPQVKAQLSTSLKAVISQQLIKKTSGGRMAVHEIMLVNDAIANMIREGKVFQITSAMQTGAKTGMVSMDASLATLVRMGKADSELAEEYCINKDDFFRYLGR